MPTPPFGQRLERRIHRLLYGFMQTYHFAHRFSRRLALASALAVMVMGSVGTPGLAMADSASAHASAAHSSSEATHSGSHVALAHSAAAHSRSVSEPTPAWQTGFFPRNTSALLASSRAFALLNTCTSHCGQASLQAAALLAALPDFSLEDGTVRTRALRTLDSRFSRIISTAEITSSDNLEGSQQASPAQTSSSAELSTRLPRQLSGAFAASYDRLAMAQKYLIIRHSHVDWKQDMLLNVQASEMFAAPFEEANEADPREKAYNWAPLASNPATVVDKATGLPAPTLAVLYMDAALEQAHALEATPQITSLNNLDRMLLLSSVARLALRAYQLGYPLILTAN